MLILPVTALASFITLVTKVVADPSDHPDSHHRRYQNGDTVRVPLTKQTLSQYNPIQSDQRRFTRLMNKTNPVTSSNLAVDTAELNMTNDADWYYLANISFGVPPTYYDLLVDTGSSNTWVGANSDNSYRLSNTSVVTTGTMVVHSGSVTFTSKLYYDTVTIAPGVAASNQPIGVAVPNLTVYPYDGILGIGPTDLTLDTASYPLNGTAFPTVTDSLFAQGTIQQYLVAVSFEPTISRSAVNGELTFGATDSTKYIGNISYFPITTNPIAGKYWGIDASIQYGGSSGNNSVVLANTTAGILDTGLNLISLPSAAYKTYANVTGAVVGDDTGMLSITEAQYENLQSLNFVIGGETFELTPDAQIWPRQLNTALSGGNSSSIYLAVRELKNAGSVDFVCGMAFLERFYSVFDSGNRSIGLAKTPFTNATTNW